MHKAKLIYNNVETSKIRLHQIKMWVLIIKKWERGIKIKKLLREGQRTCTCQLNLKACTLPTLFKVLNTTQSKPGLHWLKARALLMLHQTSLKAFTHYNKTTIIIRALKIEGFSLVFSKTQTASIVTIKLLKFQWLRHRTGKQNTRRIFC